jgi:hypothetical protein
MSHVNNWILLLEVGERHGLGQVNNWLASVDPRKQQFMMLDENSWGGTKVPEVDVYGMAANHLPTSHVLDAIREANWADPSMSALVLSPQEGGFRFWPLDKLPDII